MSGRGVRRARGKGSSQPNFTVRICSDPPSELAFHVVMPRRYLMVLHHVPAEYRYRCSPFLANEARCARQLLRRPQVPGSIHACFVLQRKAGHVFSCSSSLNARPPIVEAMFDCLNDGGIVVVRDHDAASTGEGDAFIDSLSYQVHFDVQHHIYQVPDFVQTSPRLVLARISTPPQLHAQASSS